MLTVRYLSLQTNTRTAMYREPSEFCHCVPGDVQRCQHYRDNQKLVGRSSGLKHRIYPGVRHVCAVIRSERCVLRPRCTNGLRYDSCFVTSSAKNRPITTTVLPSYQYKATTSNLTNMTKPEWTRGAKTTEMETIAMSLSSEAS